MSLLIMTMVHDFSGEGYSDVYKLSPDKNQVPEVINNNLDNYFKFNDGCHVIMHVNKTYEDFDTSKVDRPGVSILPKRFHFVHGDCQLAILLNMFKHAVDSGIDFEYVTINHSGEMYIKPGALDYMRQYEYGIWHSGDSEVKNNNIEMWPPFSTVRLAKRRGFDMFDDLFDTSDLSNFADSQLEGSFYKRELFQKIYDWFDERYEIDLTTDWAFYAEELFIPTLAYQLSNKATAGQPVCGFFIGDTTCTYHGVLEDTKYIEEIRNNNPVIAWGKDNLPFWGLRLHTAPVDSTHLYTVKRVNRIIDDPVRVAITNLER